jgi:hypothetical protein
VTSCNISRTFSLDRIVETIKKVHHEAKYNSIEGEDSSLY